MDVLITHLLAAGHIKQLVVGGHMQHLAWRHNIDR